MSLVKARVRAGNKYGSAPAGSIVEVEESELAIVPHCLVDADKEEEEREQAGAAAAAAKQKQDEWFARMRDSHVKAREMAASATLQRQEAVVAEATEKLEKIKKTRK